jgi:hypothetical protein
MYLFKGYQIHCHILFGSWVWRAKDANGRLVATSPVGFESEEICQKDACQWLIDNKKVPNN